MSRSVTYYTASVNGQSKTQTTSFAWSRESQGPNFIEVSSRWYNALTTNQSGQQITGSTSVYKDKSFSQSAGVYYGSGTPYTLTISSRNATLYDYTFAKGDGISSITRSSWTGEGGSSTTCVATVAANYVFDGWYNASGTKVSSSTTLTVTAGSTAEGKYTARAGYNLVTITVNLTGTGGSVSGGGTYTKGTQVTIRATTPADRRFLYWADGSTSPSRTITANSNATYTAVYSSAYVKTTTSGASGTAYVGGSGTLTQCYYAQGDVVTLRAAPGNASTIAFRGWYNGNTLVSSSATYSFVFGGTSVTYTARFANRQRKYTVRAANPTEGGSTLVCGRVGIKPGGKNARSVGTTYTAAFGEKLGFEAAIVDDTVNNVRIRGEFRGWYLSTDSTYSNPISSSPYFEVTVPSDYSDITYVARFVRAQTMTVTTNVSDGTGTTTELGTVQIVGYDAVVSHSGSTYTVYSGTIPFQIQPPTGYEVSGWMVDGDQQIGATGNSFTVAVSANCTITAIVTKKVYTINCNIDEASIGCGTCELQVYSGGEWTDASSNQIEYGTECRVLVAVTAQSGDLRKLMMSGESVAVNALGDGEYEYLFLATQSQTFTAYFGDVFQVAAKHVANNTYEDETNGHAYVSDDSASAGEVSSVEFTYGDTLKLYAVNSTEEGALAYFVGWHSVTTNGEAWIASDRIVGLSANASVTPAVGNPLIYWAEFKNTQEVNLVRLSNDGLTYGELSLIALDEGATVTELTAKQFDDALREYYSEPASTDPVSGTDKYYSVTLGTRVLIKCVVNNAANVPFDSWRIRNYTGYNQYDNPLGVIYGREESVEHIVDGNAAFSAEYNSSLPSKATLKYVDESDFVQGTIRLEPVGDNAVQADNYVSGDFIRNTNVSAMAFPKNGYKFVGWYLEPEAVNLVSESASYTFEKTSSAQTFYAKFTQDANGLYVWEGDEANKMMTWRSRRTRFAQPVNLSSGAVCADGYSLELKVAYASAPDPAEDGWREGEITINSQDPRRLPLLRPERYVEVEVRSDKPVLQVAVATSMTGLLG